MTEYQERRLNRLNYKIEQQLAVKHFFKRHLFKLLIISVIASFVISSLEFLTNIIDLKPNTSYNYNTIMYFFLQLILGFSVLIILGHILFWIQTYFSLKSYRKEKHLILELIENHKKDFERFENFDEIQQNTTKSK